MTIVKCHVQVQTSTQMPQFVCIMLGSRYTHCYKLKATSGGTDSRCSRWLPAKPKWPQNIYHISCTFPYNFSHFRSVCARQGQSPPVSLSISHLHAAPPRLSLSLSPCALLLQLFAKLVIYTCTRQQHEQQLERHCAFIWQKLTEHLHCNSTLAVCHVRVKIYAAHATYA